MRRSKIKTKRKITKNSHLPFLLSVLVISLLVGGVSFFQKGGSSRVLGEQAASSGKNESIEKQDNQEKPEKPEPTEVSEPKETPEPQEVKNEQETKNIQQEVQNQVRQGNVEKIEVNPSSIKPTNQTKES